MPLSGHTSATIDRLAVTTGEAFYHQQACAVLGFVGSILRPYCDQGQEGRVAWNSDPISLALAAHACPAMMSLYGGT